VGREGGKGLGLSISYGDGDEDRDGFMGVGVGFVGGLDLKRVNKWMDGWVLWCTIQQPCAEWGFVACTVRVRGWGGGKLD